MRTNIVIDDELMKKVLDSGKFRTKREAVEEGLRSLLRLEQQSQIRKLRGKLPWRGHLEKMRKSTR
jgi:Arc/MetJ family transcription regulator